MSGIAGIARSDGKPVDRELLQRMARWLSFRGPDAQQIWTDGAIGLGHAAHLIRGDSARALQPESLGTGTWIAADVRLDAREELITELRGHGQDAHIWCSDAQLLLHAYDAWGEECLDHLMGDFAFGLWDARRRQLFCACDHFGIRQLYFSQTDSYFIFSNTLDCVRLHPDVSDRLNDAAICDFLLFGMNYEEGTTSFADIKRLPRAHWLRWSANGLEVREYWRPPTDGKIRYKKRGEYVEHFNELLGKAVADRIRADSVGILLSGGLDSSSVAAVCHEIGARQGHPRELHAFTVTNENSGDSDGPAARAVADALQIPIHCSSANNTPLFGGWGSDGVHWPEPVDHPLAAGMLPQFREIAGHVSALLSGEGCDNLMICEPGQHLRRLWREGRRARAAFDAVEHVVARFQSPDGLRGPLRRIYRSLSAGALRSSFPEWISPELVERLGLKERWSNPILRIPWNEHAQHAKGYASLFLPQWKYMFERQDPAYTRAAVEVRYPFLDLRLVGYLLAIPAMPWFFRKFLLREAMRGRLPEKIRKRPKTPVRQDPLIEALRRSETFDFSKERLTGEVDRYVHRDAVESPCGGTNSEAAEMKVRLWCLNFWLEGLRKEHAVPVGMRLGGK
ncbi:MAG: asparagine synthase-related protein [Candidatus Acidiferrales bacterium]